MTIVEAISDLLRDARSARESATGLRRTKKALAALGVTADADLVWVLCNLEYCNYQGKAYMPAFQPLIPIVGG